MAFFKSYSCEVDTVYFHNSDTLADLGLPKKGFDLSHYGSILLFQYASQEDTILCLEDSTLFSGVIISDHFNTNDRMRIILDVESGIIKSRVQLYYYLNAIGDIDYNRLSKTHSISKEWILVGENINWDAAVTNFNLNGDTTYTFRTISENDDEYVEITKYNNQQVITFKSYARSFPHVRTKQEYYYFDSGKLYSVRNEKAFSNLNRLSDSSRRALFERHQSVELHAMLDEQWDVEEIVFDMNNPRKEGNGVKRRVINGTMPNVTITKHFIYDEKEILLGTSLVRSYYDINQIPDSSKSTFFKVHQLPKNNLMDKVEVITFETGFDLQNDTLYHFQLVNDLINGRVIQNYDGPNNRKIALESTWRNGYLIDISAGRVIFVDGVAKILNRKAYIQKAREFFFNNPDFTVFIVPNELKYDLQANLILYTPRSAKKLLKNPRKQEKSILRLCKKRRKIQERSGYISE